MSINIIGPITKSVSTDDPEVFEVTTLDGWHVNSTKQIVELSDYQIFPETPHNVFAGVQTYFYTFPNEATAKEIGIGVIEDE